MIFQFAWVYLYVNPIPQPISQHDYINFSVHIQPAVVAQFLKAMSEGILGQSEPVH